MGDAHARAHAHASDDPQGSIVVAPAGAREAGVRQGPPDEPAEAAEAADTVVTVSEHDPAGDDDVARPDRAVTTPPADREARDASDDRMFDPPASWWTFRGLLANVVFFWRTSLPFRTITISVALTSVTVLAVGLIMSNAIASDLFSTRLNQVLAESDRAATQAQATFSSGVETDVVALQALRSQAMEAAVSTAPNSSGYALLRADTSAGGVLQDTVSEQVDPLIISDGLRERVRAEPDTQFYQSVTLDVPDGERVPGLIVGTLVDIPTAGSYELYFVYSLEESQRTLDFIQRTLTISMLALVLLVGAISGFVMRAVVQPIRLAAIASRKLAAGQLEERIPESGEDDVATLAKSFNEMADSLQHQIERLNNLSRVQQRFVSDVSHELRTPLTTIRLAGQMLFDRRDEFGALESRSVELLHDQIERFELLLADLLEISRYDAGHVELLRERHSLAGLADEVIGSMTQVALDHGTPLVLVAPGGHGDSEFDRRRIARVVRNLIGNAIEHGEGKPIVIRVDSNETAVALSVRDYGVGMTPQQAARAFDRFWRADPSRKRTMGGSGLGLAISNEDALLHDGRLDVWSTLGGGSNFRLTLPRHVDDEIVLSPLQLEPADAGASEPTLDTPITEAGDAFVDEDVDTQPIVLPDVDPDVPVTQSIELPTIGASEPPSEHPAPWEEIDEVVVVTVPEETFAHERAPDAAGDGEPGEGEPVEGEPEGDEPGEPFGDDAGEPAGEDDPGEAAGPGDERGGADR